MKIRCANCSAQIGLERDDAFFVCPYCASSLYLDRAHTFKSFLLPPAITETGARDQLAHELATREIPPTPVKGVQKILLPYWGVRGEALQETIPAYSPEYTALQSFRLPAAGAVFYQNGLAADFEPVPCSERSSARWEERPDVSSFALYRVPFYKIIYGSGTVAYTAWIDGVGGRTFADVTPPAVSTAITSRFLKLVVALFLVFVAEAALVPGFGLSLLVVGLTAAAAFPLVRRYAVGGGP